MNAGNGHSTTVYPIRGSGAEAAAPSSLMDRLDGLIASIRQLETSLSLEQARNQRISEELAETKRSYERFSLEAKKSYDRLSEESRKTQDRLATEATKNEMDIALKASERENRARRFYEDRLELLSEKLKKTEHAFHELEVKHKEQIAREVSLKTLVEEFRKRDAETRGRFAALKEQFEQVTAELQRYKSSWAIVLEREREAKKYIIEGRSLQKQLNDFRVKNKAIDEKLAAEQKKREQVERHAETYQAELQNTLVRLHSAEGKFAELSRELQARNESRKQSEEELEKIRRSIEERCQWEIHKERETIRTELKREATLEISLIRERNKQEIEALQQELQAVRAQAKSAEAALCETAGLQKTAAEQRASALANELTQLKFQSEQKVARLEEKIKVLERERDELAENLSAARNSAAVHVDHEELLNHGMELQAELARQKKEAEQALLEARRQIEDLQRLPKKEASDRVASLVSKVRDRLRSKGARDFEQAFDVEVERSKSLEKALLAERQRFDQALESLHADLEKMRTVNPLKDLLALKEVEIKNASKELVPGLTEQKNRLHQLLEEAEARFNEQAEKIEIAMTSDILEAEEIEIMEASGPEPALHWPEIGGFPGDDQRRIPEC